ncbi:VOC family protein [Rhodococcus sp. D2-41]|uniref:VOC family protein n=1 Tax=Speluncibacter jeojiensis TaxID=2710754 RepID=A0A9X4M4X2_9ACTN|nr:VOC family protein [Rhodococcus sp. D2-41]MDG3009218.1 VOC family protein [Rhodococcus sp. D2-41]MDG3016107.1 VOC family protein [Corynebacteriales bacterium D3-21]
MEILSSRAVLRPLDYERTLTFYRDLLGLAVYREYPGGTVFFAGQSLVEIAGHPGPEPASGAGSHTALWLQVRDVHRTQDELTAAGVEIVRPATQEPWGLIEMWIHDPDGVPIVFVEVPAEHPIRRDTRPADRVRPSGA